MVIIHPVLPRPKDVILAILDVLPRPKDVVLEYWKALASVITLQSQN